MCISEENEKERKKRYLEQAHSVQMYIFSEINCEIRQEMRRRNPQLMIEEFWEEINLYGNGRGMDDVGFVNSGNRSSSFVETVAIRAAELEEQVKELAADPNVNKELTEEERKEICERVYKRIADERPEMISVRNEIIDVIEGVKNLRGRIILKRRFLKGYSWCEIQSELKLAKTRAFELFDAALDEITIPAVQEDRELIDW